MTGCFECSKLGFFSQRILPLESKELHKNIHTSWEKTESIDTGMMLCQLQWRSSSHFRRKEGSQKLGQGSQAMVDTRNKTSRRLERKLGENGAFISLSIAAREDASWP